MKEVLVIGGGISGLTCGWHLAEAGYRVTILEKEAVLGGLARSFLIKDKWIPLAYHHVMSPDKVTLEYVNKFGLSSQLHWIKSSQVFWYENRPYLLSQPQHILGFDPLDLKGKIRLFYLGLYIWFKKDWDDLKGLNCHEWLTKIVGKKTTALLFQNLMDIKFNMSLSSVSAAWLGRRMHQSIRNNDRYGYIKPGWQELINKMADRIVRRNGKIVTDFEVTKISKNTVVGPHDDGRADAISADIIISTVPPPVLNRLWESEYSLCPQLERIKYKSIISFVCGSSQQISKNYWSVILKPHLIFGGFFNHTVLCPSIAKNGEYIYYFFTYLEDNDPLMNYDNHKLNLIYLNDIKKIFPDFRFNWAKIFKLRFSQPIFMHDYSNPPVEAADGIYLSGIYRQFPKPRTMDAAFYSGYETSQYIINKYGKD